MGREGLGRSITDMAAGITAATARSATRILHSGYLVSFLAI
jgi:hypothetical protein